jgi:hypothetical protein
MESRSISHPQHPQRFAPASTAFLTSIVLQLDIDSAFGSVSRHALLNTLKAHQDQDENLTNDFTLVDGTPTARKALGRSSHWVPPFSYSFSTHLAEFTPDSSSSSINNANPLQELHMLPFPRLLDPGNLDRQLHWNRTLCCQDN